MNDIARTSKEQTIREALAAARACAIYLQGMRVLGGHDGYATQKKAEAALKLLDSTLEPFAKRRPSLDESNAWTSAEEERDWWRNYALEIERAAQPPGAKCEWGYDAGDDVWQTACGQMHVFMDRGPAENDHKFCPYCGKGIDDLSQPTPTKAGEHG